MAGIHTPIPSLKLNDGTSIPMISYGTGTAWFKRDSSKGIDRSLVEGIKTAVGLGYYHFDCAEAYNNEAEVGVALKESGLDRSKFYVTTKVLSSIADVDNAIRNSLKKLQLDYVDLYLIHAPYFADDGKNEGKLQSTWAAMEKLKESGLAKSIGVSNFLPQHIEAILKTAKVPPAVNQVEFHPYLQRETVIAANKKHGIATESFGPLSAVSKAAPGPVDDYVAALAKKYAVSAAEINLRWAMDQDVVVVTTSAKEQRLSDYLRVTRFKLTPEEIRRVSALGSEKHFRGFFGARFDKDDRT